MEKHKRWQLFLILAVVFLTIYNILPTITYYSNPLKKQIGSKEAEKVALEAVGRVNSLEKFTLSWLKAQSNNLGLKPVEIALDKEDPRLAHITFKKPESAKLFAKTLQRAGSLIPFVPAQLSADPRSFDEGATTVSVQRRIGVHLDPKQLDTYFQYIPKTTPDGEISPVYRDLVNDRAALIATGLGGKSEPAKTLSTIAADPSDNGQSEGAIRLARQIVEYENAFGDTSPITQRYYAGFNTPSENNTPAFISHLEKINQQLSGGIKTLQEIRAKGEFLDSAQLQKLEVFENQKNIIDSAVLIIKRNSAAFTASQAPLTREQVVAELSKTSDKIYSLSLGNRNPFVQRIDINWSNDTIELILYPEINTIRSLATKTETVAITLEKLNQLLFNEIASVARFSEETITPTQTDFILQLNDLTNSSSLLALDIGAVAALQVETIQKLLNSSWTPSQKELSKSDYPIYEYGTFKELPAEQQKLGLVIYAPAMADQPEEGFRNGSIYVIAKGLNPMIKKNRESGVENELFEADFRALQDLLRQNGFISYSGGASDLPSAYRNDYIFELDDYYSYLIAATREKFSVKGSKNLATLEFTDVEQRLLTLNKIETSAHEDLLKWKDEYQSSQVSLVPGTKYDVPKPTKSVLWNNLKLSFAKYFRGDERKILRWGLDLSGGKTVRIGLKDQNNQPITEEADLKQAVNELYQRVNRLGVSEVGIRTEGSNIVLDFPGSQGLSASDLIQASAMYFHVVNEKFSANNPTLSEAVNTFLEEVWNEAVITNRTDPESLNVIAWQHLGGNPENPAEFQPLSSHSKLLYENGLRFAGPRSLRRSATFDDTISAITTFRGTDYSEWQGQTYP
ncbi:MAG: hypothetical protein K1000chlam4_00481, partial [Chlamydiae bacterium]|nr:hypothetical protein [Chlamydiota bacterium]